MAFTELFLLLTAGLVLKGEVETEPGIPIPFNEALARQFTDSLPYSLTDGQRGAAWQIVGDLARARPMNRFAGG